MFSRAKKQGSSASAVQSPPPKPASPSVISTDMRITGDIVSEGEIQVDGTIEGDIRTKVLLVGETANIRGEIVADSVKVHGAITGQIKARAVTLAAAAKMYGDILHGDLAIEKGAFLEGHCKRIDPPEPPETKAVGGKVSFVVKSGGPEEGDGPGDGDKPATSGDQIRDQKKAVAN
ncbi:MAG: polymer-forming cytoskeletal protein [Rhodospirillales bacterium]|nr:polymer-forming cytoskeletal protein [Rhodospirillales bacterium]